MEERREHERRITDLEGRMNRFEASLNANTLATQQVAENTTEIVQLIKGAKTFRSFLLWVAPIAAFILWMWTYLKEHWK